MIESRIISPHDLRGARINRASWQANGLHAVWNANVFPGGGMLYDRGAKSANGTITLATWGADSDSRIGYCLDFSGDPAARVGCGTKASLSGTGDFAVSAWVKVGVASSPQVIIEQRDSGGYEGQFALRISATGLVTFHVYNGGYQFQAQSSSEIDDGIWHQVWGVRRGTAGYIYIDGRQDGTHDLGLTQSLVNTLSLWIGYSQRDSNAGWEGRIGEICLRTRAPSAAEIGAIYADPYGLWDVGDEAWGYAEAAAAGGTLLMLMPNKRGNKGRLILANKQ